MMQRFRLGRLARRTRPFVANFALLVFLLTATGIPLPGVRVKPSDVAYPCMNHPCGCTDAAACWRHCCCFTHEEKIAWARARSIDPLADCVADSSDGSHDVSDTCCHNTASAAATQPTSSRFELVVSHLALRCQGVSSVWVTLGAALPVPAVDWNPSLEPFGWVQQERVTAISAYFTPPVPPPRA
jgi:hypothetical protein